MSLTDSRESVQHVKPVGTMQSSSIESGESCGLKLPLRWLITSTLVCSTGRKIVIESHYLIRVLTGETARVDLLATVGDLVYARSPTCM